MNPRRAPHGEGPRRAYALARHLTLATATLATLALYTGCGTNDTPDDPRACEAGESETRACDTDGS